MARKWRKVLDRRNGIEVDLGDETEPRSFHPRLTFKRWDGEAKFSVRLIDIWPGDAEAVVLNGRTKWKKADVEALFYQLRPTPTLRDGGFEFEVILKKPPPTNQIRFRLEAKNLDFFYQPPLTPGQVLRGCRRPERAVGSYAVYHKERAGDFTALGGKNYRTGKAFHIYRPRVKDAQGDEIWADLAIDEVLGYLTITVDPLWLANAAYPVSVDPTFGYDTIGGASGQAGDSEIFSSGSGAPASDGVVTTLHIYGMNAVAGDTKISVGLYTDDGEPTPGPETKVGTEKETTLPFNDVARWMDFLTNALDVTAAAFYWPSANSDKDLTVYFDSPAGTNRYWDTHTYGVAWPTTHAQDTFSAAKYSMYCTYVAAGGIQVRSATTGGGITGSGADNLPVNKPSLVENDDYLVCFIGKDDDVAISAIPAGWVEGDTAGTTLGNDIRVGIYYKKITNAGGEPSIYYFTTDSGEEFYYWIGALTGVHLTQPEDVAFSGRFLHRENDQTPSADSVTTVTDGAFVLACWYSDYPDTADQPGGLWVSRAHYRQTANYLNAASLIKDPYGATGNAELQNLPTGDETYAGQFPFRPAPPAAQSDPAAFVGVHRMRSRNPLLRR